MVFPPRAAVSCGCARGEKEAEGKATPGGVAGSGEASDVDCVESALVEG